MDENLEIMILGLAKQQKATLHAVITEGRAVFESCCCFTSDDDGNIDLASHPSLAGSYTGMFKYGTQHYHCLAVKVKVFQILAQNTDFEYT